MKNIFFLFQAKISNSCFTFRFGQMLTGNVPNDIIQNINPFSLIVVIPIMDRIFYPLLRRFGISMRPIMRISIGFGFVGISMYVMLHH